MALLTINDREYIVEAGTLLSDAIGLHHTRASLRRKGKVRQMQGNGFREPVSGI